MSIEQSRVFRERAAAVDPWQDPERADAREQLSQTELGWVNSEARRLAGMLSGWSRAAISRRLAERVVDAVPRHRPPGRRIDHVLRGRREGQRRGEPPLCQRGGAGRRRLHTHLRSRRDADSRVCPRAAPFRCRRRTRACKTRGRSRSRCVHCRAVFRPGYERVSVLSCRVAGRRSRCGPGSSQPDQFDRSGDNRDGRRGLNTLPRLLTNAWGYFVHTVG